MEKDLCLKFLVHLHKFSTAILQKAHIDEIDITYINNEVDNFQKRLTRDSASGYDPVGALQKIVRIESQTKTDQAVNIAKFLIKAKYKWLHIFTGQKDDAHVQRHKKITAFNETVRKVLAMVEYGQTAKV